MTDLFDFPPSWRPMLSALLEVLDEYAPGMCSLVSAQRVDGSVHITLTVPWHSDSIVYAHKVAERALTKIGDDR